MRFTGPILALLVILLAMILAVQSYAPYGFQNAVGIALGAAAIAAMSIGMVLATRFALLEPFFGGLDRMYLAHKWFGIAALVLMLGHNALEPDLDAFVNESRWGDLAAELGEFALNGFIVLILISWFKRIPFLQLEIPWPIWRWTHRFTGILFALTAFHQWAVDKPSLRHVALDRYLNALCLLGLVSWVFTQWLAPRLRSRPFKLDRVNRFGTTAELILRPVGKVMDWKPGQFAFVSAPEAGMTETHPFTIAGAPRQDGSLIFYVKGLGGWTRRLPDRLVVGQKLRIEGPYGRFLFPAEAKHQVWLAGGVGVTPFLAWADALPPDHSQEIVLVWVVRRAADTFAMEHLSSLVARQPKLWVHVLIRESGSNPHQPFSERQQDGERFSVTTGLRLTAQTLVDLTPFSMSEAVLCVCGPSGLRDAMLSGLKTLNKQPRAVMQELFELR